MRRPTILIADDEPDIRLLFELTLRRSGRFELLPSVGDGLAAVEAAARHQPDIVLLDIMMPEMDGREALPRILSASPRSMVVIISALAADLEAPAARTAGAFAYIEKDAVSGALVEVLEDLHAQFAHALEGETVIAPASQRWPVTAA